MSKMKKCILCKKLNVWDEKPGFYCPVVAKVICVGKHWDMCKECWEKVDSEKWVWGPDSTFAKVQKMYWKLYSSYGVPRKGKGGPLCLWYSVRPPPEEYSEEQFIARISKFVNSVCITRGVYTFEWKYEGGTLRNGIHCHMLLYGSEKRINFHINRQKEKMFNLCKKQKWWITDLEIVKDKIDYMQGDTLDDDKNKEKLLDKQSRVELGLKDLIYIKCESV